MKFSSRQLANTFGLLALAAATPAALAITGATPTTAFDAVGRGIQVAPNWVMVAQHYSLGPSDIYTNGFGSWTVAASYWAPGSGVFPAHDFALMRLVPNTITAPYVAVSADVVPEGTFAPVDVTMVSAANSGPDRGYAFNTISEAMVTADPDDAGPLGPVVVNWLASWNSSVYVVGGDSGSALFAGQVLDTGLLLGVASAQFQGDNGTPIGSAYVQPAAYRSWIDSVMAADTSDDQVVNRVSAAAVPEPASWALALCGGAALLARRRAAAKQRA